MALAASAPKAPPEGWERLNHGNPIMAPKGDGFESAGVRPGYYHDNKEDALIMWRTVAEAQPAA